MVDGRDGRGMEKTENDKNLFIKNFQPLWSA